MQYTAVLVCLKFQCVCVAKIFPIASTSPTVKYDKHKLNRGEVEEQNNFEKRKRFERLNNLNNLMQSSLFSSCYNLTHSSSFLNLALSFHLYSPSWSQVLVITLSPGSPSPHCFGLQLDMNQFVRDKKWTDIAVVGIGQN